MQTQLDVLIPTYRRPTALAMTLTALCAQTLPQFRVIISDQAEDAPAAPSGEVQAALRLLRAKGRPAELHRHLPRRGMAEQRQFLLDSSSAPYVLFLDDDILLEADMLERLLKGMDETGAGFVGSAVIGLSYLHDRRPHQQAIDLWDGPVRPEAIQPGGPEWQRHQLHNAANLLHVQEQMGLAPGTQRYYRVAWVGGCVLYDAAKLRDVGGFGFWPQLPDAHAGEDVLAQLRVMARYGGCGMIPSGAYHMELPTTVSDRRVDAPRVLPLDPQEGAAVNPGPFARWDVDA